MDSAEFLRGLLEGTLASTGAVLLVLVLRGPLRSTFGPAIGYASWALVPASLLAVLLPARRMVDAGLAPTRIVPGKHVMLEALPSAGTSPLDLLLVIWLLGAVAMACRFAMQQQAFRKGLGTLRRRDDGCDQAETALGLPAAMGLWRSRVVMPSDFDCRYSREQRELIQLHERIHIQRGDLHANAAMVLFRCLFWFNPLIHAASRHFRHDQELACDAAVIARHPQHRRAYGEAMLHTQLACQPLPLACHWEFSHPLKERIEMLKQRPRSKSRTAAGFLLAGALVAGVGTVAWAAQPARLVPIAVASAPAVINPEAGDASPYRNPPKYPVGAAEAKVSGRVSLLIDIDPAGRPTAVEVDESTPPGVFDQAAMDAAWQWRFNPEMKNGKPVASRVRVPVDFEADGDPPDGDDVGDVDTGGATVARGSALPD